MAIAEYLWEGDRSDEMRRRMKIEMMIRIVMLMVVVMIMSTVVVRK